MKQIKNEIKAENIDKLEKEDSAVEVALEVQEFDPTFSQIENAEEVDKKVIEYLEKLIRKSFEYKQYITYLKQELDITKCVLIPELDIRELDFGLEFHHYPLSLYDIAETVLNKYLNTKKPGEKISCFSVMETVMKEHYEGSIGLVPLSTSIHKMCHAGSLKIAANHVYGNYGKFYEKYKQFMSPELIDKFVTRCSINEEEASLFNKTKLKDSVIHYDITYRKKVENEADDQNAYKGEE